jgi:hypothetical protein
VSHNPVRGVKRPKADNNEGKTPVLGNGQARTLLEAPPSSTLKGKRDRAILATFLHHGLRCEELCGLRVLGPPESPGETGPNWRQPRAVIRVPVKGACRTLSAFQVLRLSMKGRSRCQTLKEARRRPEPA